MHAPSRYSAGASGARAMLCRLVLLAVLGLLLSGCQAAVNATATAGPAANPTGTLTPAGDVLRIDGDTVLDVLIPASEPDTLYALTDDGLFALVKGEWQHRASEASRRHYLVDPDEPARIFRGDHPPCGLDRVEQVIPLDVSEDGGTNWRRLEHGANVRPLAFDPTDHDVLYGSNCGLVYTVDGGLTWNDINALPGYGVTDVAVVNGRLLVLGSNPQGETMLRSVDVTDPSEPVIGDVLLKASGQGCMDASGERIIVGTSEGVSISSDGGLTWAESRIGLEPVTTEGQSDTSRITGVKRSAEFGIQAIVFDRQDPHRIFAGTGHGLFVSQDDGVTWVRYTEIPSDASVTAIQFGQGDADLYVTTSLGVIMVPKP